MIKNTQSITLVILFAMLSVLVTVCGARVKKDLGSFNPQTELTDNVVFENEERVYKEPVSSSQRITVKSLGLPASEVFARKKEEAQRKKTSAGQVHFDFAYTKDTLVN